MPSDRDDTARRGTACLLCDFSRGAPDVRTAFCAGFAVHAAMAPNEAGAVPTCARCAADVAEAMAAVVDGAAETRRGSEATSSDCPLCRIVTEAPHARAMLCAGIALGMRMRADSGQLDVCVGCARGLAMALGAFGLVDTPDGAKAAAPRGTVH